MSDTNGSERGELTLKLPTQIVFMIASVAFGAAGVLDPFGIIGLVLAVISAAMLALLALGSRKSRLHGLPVFLLSPISLLVGAALLTAFTDTSPETLLAKSLIALFPTAMALPIWLTVLTGKGRSTTIVASALCSVLLWGAYFALMTSQLYGSLGVETIKQMLDDQLLPLHDALTSITFDKDGTNIRYFTDADIDSMLYSVKTLLIGSVAAMMLVISYLATLAARLIAACFDIVGLFPSSLHIRVRVMRTENGPRATVESESIPWRIELDSVSAVMMICAYLVSIFLTSDSLLPAAITAQNLILILLPGFVYAGARSIFGGFPRGSVPTPEVSSDGEPRGAVVMNGRVGSGAGRGCLVTFMLFLLVFVNPMTLALMLAIVGVITVLRENSHKRHAEMAAAQLRDGDGSMADAYRKIFGDDNDSDDIDDDDDDDNDNDDGSDDYYDDSDDRKE